MKKINTNKEVHSLPLYKFKNFSVFLDRDNTINVDEGYTHDPNLFQWKKGAPDSLKLFKSLSIPVFVVTNQAGIAKGLFNKEQMDEFHKKLIKETKIVGGEIKDISFCPHHKLAKIKKYRVSCDCRKPKPGMILALAKKWNRDLSKSFLIGDKKTDVKAGIAAGCQSFLLKKEQSLLNVAEKIISIIKSK